VYICQNYEKWFIVDKDIGMKKCHFDHPVHIGIYTVSGKKEATVFSA